MTATPTPLRELARLIEGPLSRLAAYFPPDHTRLHDVAEIRMRVEAALSARDEAGADEALIEMLRAARDDIDEMAKRQGASRFPSVPQMTGWRRMLDSVIRRLSAVAPEDANGNR